MDESLAAQDLEQLLATLEALGCVERTVKEGQSDYRPTAKGIAFLVTPFRQQIGAADDDEEAGRPGRACRPRAERRNLASGITLGTGGRLAAQGWSYSIPFSRAEQDPLVIARLGGSRLHWGETGRHMAPLIRASTFSCP
jgi:hypothetical protein